MKKKKDKKRSKNIYWIPDCSYEQVKSTNKSVGEDGRSLGWGVIQGCYIKRRLPTCQ